MSEALVEIAKASGAKGAGERMAAVEAARARFYVARPDGKETRRLPVAMLPNNPYEILELLWKHVGKQAGVMALMILPGEDDGDPFGFPVDIPDLIPEEDEGAKDGEFAQLDRMMIYMERFAAMASVMNGGGGKNTLVAQLKELKAAQGIMSELNGDSETEAALLKMAPDLLRVVAPEKTA